MFYLLLMTLYCYLIEKIVFYFTDFKTSTCLLGILKDLQTQYCFPLKIEISGDVF